LPDIGACWCAAALAVWTCAIIGHFGGQASQDAARAAPPPIISMIAANSAAKVEIRGILLEPR
jgi:hypothetical protein